MKYQSLRFDDLLKALKQKGWVSEKTEVTGDGGLVIQGVSSPRIAQPEELCFIEKEKYLEDFKSSRSQAWLTTQELFDQVSVDFKNKKTFLVVPKPYSTFVKCIELMLRREDWIASRHSTAVVHASARVDETAQIGPHVVIEAGVQVGQRVHLGPGVWIGRETVIGDDSVIYSGVKIYDHCIVGKRNVLHAGAVVGSDGFGFLTENGRVTKIPQLGRVVLGDDVEIGANSTIDRGTLEDTEIGRGTKIDNLVQVGHNCKIGENCIFCAFVGVSGNTSIGNNVLLAGQVGTKGHMKIGSNVQVGAQSGVSKDIPDNVQVKGYPPMPLQEYLRLQVLIQKLPEFNQRLRDLEGKSR